MTLSFTDAQIREITGQILNSDAKISIIQNNMNEVEKLKQDYLDLDNQEAVFTNNFHNIIQRFHNEMRIINSISRTNYDLSNIDSSARLASGNLHFPPSWEEFKPLVIDSNKGMPENDLGSPNEIYNNNKVLFWSNKIINGFSSPSSYTGSYISGTLTFTGSGSHPNPSVGSEIFITQSLGSIFGTVSSVNTVVSGTPPSTTTTTTIIISTVDSINTVAGSVTVYLGYLGFTQAVRISSSTDPFLTFCKSMLDKYTTDVKTNATDENNELSNNYSKPDSSQIQNAENNNNQHIAIINSWKTIPGQNRFNDSNLSNLNTKTNQRVSVLNSRVVEIVSSLGDVSQSQENISGSGRYLDLYNSISIRIHKTVGHLRNYYQQGLLAKNFNEMIYVAQTQNSRDKDLYIIKLFNEQPNGNQVRLKDISSININDEVMIMENQYNTIIRCKVIAIQEPNILELDETITQNYKLENQARLVKNKS